MLLPIAFRQHATMKKRHAKRCRRSRMIQPGQCLAEWWCPVQTRRCNIVGKNARFSKERDLAERRWIHDRVEMLKIPVGAAVTTDAISARHEYVCLGGVRHLFFFRNTRKNALIKKSTLTNSASIGCASSRSSLSKLSVAVLGPIPLAASAIASLDSSPSSSMPHVFFT